MSVKGYLTLDEQKQNKLVAGTNIKIENDIISATDTIYDDTEIKEEIEQLQANKLDKVYSPGKKLYGVAENGSQITYTAGEGIELTDDGKINSNCGGGQFGAT